MQQWHKCKYQSKGALLLFRLGDFYEAFYEDAQNMSEILGLTLTSRQKIPMCGVPAHAAQNYIDKLIAQGIKIAVAEQVGENKELMQRKVVRFITPGTALEGSNIKDDNNFFVALAFYDDLFVMAVLDLSTSEFKGYSMESLDDAITEVQRLNPSEILISQRFYDSYRKTINEMSRKKAFLLTVNKKCFDDYQEAVQYLISFWPKIDSLKIEPSIMQVTASLLDYLESELLIDCRDIPQINYEKISGYMKINESTLEALDIIPHKKNSASLMEFINRANTAMGSRLLTNWLKKPLLSKEGIDRRLDAIGEILENSQSIEDISEVLKKVVDLQRMMVRIERKIVNPKQLIATVESLLNVKNIATSMSSYKKSFFKYDVGELPDPTKCVDLVKNAINDDPSVIISDGNVIRDGYNKELDEMRLFAQERKAWLASYQNDLQEKYNIKTLKVSYNRVFGYYIEVPAKQSFKIPDHFSKKQTLKNNERFISSELKEYEAKILTVEEKIKRLEANLYDELLDKFLEYKPLVSTIAIAIAKIDAIMSLARVASENDYVAPIIDEGKDIYIEGGRHPLLESTTEFVANDICLNENQSFYIISGPNMGGKSTYIRQVALIVIMAQIGSYVPATSASIGIVDKVFSRIGASDDIHLGQSTFMVEMTETAYILRNMTDRSLILLDEIGRGTSTCDGVAIAQAIVRYILDEKKAKTLFTTHYLELTTLEKDFRGIVNYRVDVAEINGKIIFLHKIVAGAANKSYGLEVARLAGLPSKCLQLANTSLL